MLKLIERTTPRIKDCFVVETISETDGCECYKITVSDGKIVLSGSSVSAQCMAYYRYLHDYCKVVIINGDYDISTLGVAPLPQEETFCKIEQKIRARMSYEMFSLQGNFWGFDRWEKEIDFMAMNGINVALQPVGFDGVMFKLLDDLGMGTEFSAEFSSGPAFIMRQLTGNIAATNSVNSKAYLERKIAIGKLITEREKELGITPVLPAMIPTVPFSLRKKDTKMEIFKAPMWYNFPPIFFIKPQNYYFKYYNKRFLEMQKTLIGETDAFFCEPLYDVSQKGFSTHLENLGKELGDLLDEVCPDSVCYTHASSISADFFSKANAEKYVVINDNNAEWLSGKTCIAEINGNKYGRTGIYGNVNKLAENPYAQNKGSLLGTALSLDSLDENPMYCYVALKAMTESDGFDADDAVKDFCERRYKNSAYSEDMVALKNLCCADEARGSVICARPCTNLKHTAPFDSIEPQYELAKLYEIAKNIISKDDTKNGQLRHDLMSIVRQILSDLAHPVYKKATEFFLDKDVRNFEQASNLFIEICEDMERLLKTDRDTCLCTKYELAQETGDNKDEKEALQINYLMLHTIWGPFDHSVLYDTVWNEWAGLIKDYYAGRWYMYFRALAAYFKNPKKLKDNSKKQILDRNEYKGSYQAKRLALFENNFLENYIPRKDGVEEEDTLTVCQELMEKYSQVIYQF